MSKNKKRGLTVILTLVFFVIMLMGMMVVTRDKSGIAKNKDLYTHGNDYDVLILGSSHSVMGILPLELWNHNGITSYNLANYGQSLGVDYWVLRNALRYTNPKVVVIDVYTLFFDEKYSVVHLPYLHQHVDNMPLSSTKIELYKDLFADEFTMEFVFPFSLYHSRWDKLTTSDFMPTESSGQLGADVNQYIGQSLGSTDAEQIMNLHNHMHEYDLLPTTEVCEEKNISFDYLEMMIQLCQENDIEVMLVMSPAYCTEDNQRYINSVYEYADKYNVHFLNGLWENNVYYEADFFDTAHLNSSGAFKWSDYVGDYLCSNYSLTNHKGEEGLEYFDDYYVEWNNMMFDKLKENTSLFGTLVLAYNPNFKTAITISDETFLEDMYLKALVDNVGCDVVIDSESKADFCIKVISTLTNEEYSCCFIAVEGEIDASTIVFDKQD
ncbi:MAG: hypothetical protein MJ093_00650 [Saccharofermentans sp.]|nr:hypothetical protein [Saccharofermentans sp.]